MAGGGRNTELVTSMVDSKHYEIWIGMQNRWYVVLLICYILNIGFLKPQQLNVN